MAMVSKRKRKKGEKERGKKGGKGRKDVGKELCG